MMSQRRWEHTMSAGQQLLVFGAGIQHALKLQLAELSRVHYGRRYAVEEGI